ncbi:MAG TPA: electron transfer flavoprotein subunit beta/FixA family protein [Spirochaetota bacterium]|nr:electron transfer flavoprotein subunit beta/FixA family protein [Spirochaetota bacterium]HNT10762.1 electron transfer flavoprotein subunit beta/FixA family protein [Spirochaetota bacterium]HNV49068.1 electron transfer flavoprotein subunit beta/FixA family protein [Spirochaetota bacterium]HOS41386.1 electron transfer flavoprotein subunit beta/FixA family protein [Spirochaetota bacterium]HPU88795.1 electron transfer flavoprotein subunit beta/FixA family protein [Spirochaetota bacterium]
MKIVVCVKEVPDMESKFKIIGDSKIDESQIAFKMNDFDQYAVEAALQLKEKFGGEVMIVSAGPERVAKEVRQAFAMGADWGIQVQDPEVDAGDSFVVASALFGAIKTIGDVDLVLTGVQAEDDQAAVTGVMIADMMGVPHCTNVVKLDVDGKNMKVNRELEGGKNEVIEMAMPAVLSIQSGMNQPRYPTLPGIMKAKKKRLDVKKAAEVGCTAVGAAGSKTSFVKMFFPVSDHKAEIIQGDPKAAAATLVNKLKNEAKVL